MERPDLVFGLIGAIGTDLEAVSGMLEESLNTVGYDVTSIKMIDLILALGGRWGTLPQRSDPTYYDRAMNAGNRLRKKLQLNDALARLAVARIRDIQDVAKRKRDRNTRPQAFILSSLKRLEEVELLRLTYGSTFFAISAYSPRKARVDRLAKQLAMRQHRNQSNALRDSAERLILRDESEQIPFGQDVRKTYPAADFFVRSSPLSSLKLHVSRFIELVFGNMWHTPSIDEQGMMFAFVSGLRSASPARQVGAALFSRSGQILGTGVNEVPRAGGGQYWEGDEDDGRDFLYDTIDTSDRMRLNLLTDVLVRLKELKVLDPSVSDVTALLKRGSKSEAILREAQLFDTIDFIRAVHAEMSALLSATGSTNP